MSLITDYRPQTLDKVIGQKAAVSVIRNILGRKKPAHTWLLIGPSGTGKTTIARILAGHFSDGNIGPLNVIDHDCAVHNSAEDIRDLTIKAQYRSLGKSPVKSIIADEIQNLSAKGFDALLKSTEEPPAHVYWFLCTTNPAKIPETLKTRCAKISLKPVNEADIFELLNEISETEKLNALPEVLELIAENSNGSPRQALSNLEVCAHSKSAGEARELLRTAADLKGPVELARFLLASSRQPKLWKDAMQLVQALENVEAESVRIITMNYLAGALAKAKSNDEALRILSIMQEFGSPYNSSEKLAPLLMSIGAAMGIGR